MNAYATVAAPVRARHAGDVVAGSLTVRAGNLGGGGGNDAFADTLVIAVGLVVVTVNGTDARVTSGAVTEALFTSSGSAEATNGSVIVESISNNRAVARSNATSGGLVAVGVGKPTANVNATTRATLDGTVDAADSVLVKRRRP